MRPEWVINPIKYDRALLEAKADVVRGAAKEVTEAAVKTIYVRMAGLLLEDASENIQANEARPEIRAKKRKK